MDSAFAFKGRSWAMGCYPPTHPVLSQTRPAEIARIALRWVAADSPSRKCSAMIPLALGCAAVFPGPRGSHLMSRMIDVFAGGMLPAGLRRPGSAALACAALIGLGTSVWFGYGYVHYQRIAVGEDAAMRRVES